jgi:opacity protein-like surface antigen
MRAREVWIVPSLVVLLAGAGEAKELIGKGGVGGSIGVMKFTGGKDFERDAAPRPILQGMFKYCFSRHFAATAGSGFGWNSYGDRPKDATSADTIIVVIPTTFGVEYRYERRPTARWVPNAGAGFGFYNLAVKDGRRHFTRDPSTQERRRETSPGLFGAVGVEYFPSNSASISFDLRWHKIFSEDPEKFPVGYGDDASYGEARLGASYYFTIRSTGPVPVKREAEEEPEETPPTP